MYRPPFSPPQAAAARIRMGLTPLQVAQSMAACGVPVHPDLVEAWEQGSHDPTEGQLFALADALWCEPTLLMDLVPTTLREHRLARRLSPERLADRIGMDPDTYRADEELDRWTGDYRQTKALAAALGMSLRQLVCAVQDVGWLVEQLRAAIEGRWKPCVAPIARMTTVSEGRVADALRVMHGEYAGFSERYMGHLVARNDDVRLKEIAAERKAYLRDLVDHFWELIGETVEELPDMF